MDSDPRAAYFRYHTSSVSALQYSVLSILCIASHYLASATHIDVIYDLTLCPLPSCIVLSSITIIHQTNGERNVYAYGYSFQHPH